MKNWTYVDVPGWQDHQEQFRKFVLERVHDSNETYNYISPAEFVNGVPGLAKIICEQFDQVERLIIFKMTKETMLGRYENRFIHVDSSVQRARLNWPILNPTSVITKYFEPTDSTVVPTRHLINPPYKDYIDIYNPAAVKEVDAVCVDRPTVFTVTSPHGMFINGDTWPRIMASFNFQNTEVLEKYLEI